MTTRKTKHAANTAIGYVRVSTTRQAEDGVSLDAQRKKINDYCALNELELKTIFADEGVSGKKCDNRPGLQKAIAHACKYKSVLVVYSLSRLARSARDCIDMCARLETFNADLALIAEKIDTTSAMGRFMFQLMASLGELERAQASERTSMAARYKLSKGEAFGFVPYGFNLTDDRERLEPHPGQQIIIGYITRRHNEGGSLHAISKELNGAGIAPQRGGKWHRSSVRSVILTQAAR